MTHRVNTNCTCDRCLLAHGYVTDSAIAEAMAKVDALIKADAVSARQRVRASSNAARTAERAKKRGADPVVGARPPLPSKDPR